jgi:hypothetical protein
MLSKVLIGMMLMMGIIGYFYYNTTQAEIITLRDLNKAYELKFETQEDTISQLQTGYAVQTESLNDMISKNAEINNEMNRYLDIFRRHDLARLAAAKPGLIEPKINGATKDVFDSLENDSSFIDNIDK